MTTKNIGRNDPCPCGSKKKYKQCCQNKETTNSVATKNRLLESIPDLFKQAVKAHLENDLIIAEKLYQEILNINSKHIDSLHNLGITYRKSKKLEESAQLLQKLVRLEPTAQHYCTLAETLEQQLKHDEAIESLKKAVSLNPGDAIAYNNLGNSLWSLNRFNEAIPYFQKAISLNSQHPSILGNLGLSYSNLGNYKEASYYLRQAIAASPQRFSNYSSLLFCLCFDDEAFPRVYLEEALRLDAILKQLYPQPYQHINTKINKSILRIGFVSGDLHSHPVGFFLESILNHLNPQKIELFAYQTINFTDDLTQRIKPLFKKWHHINTLNDAEAAQQIYDDKVDILIDLAGHTASNRLSLFALKPAPIQISWLGYWASTGLSFMDYFISDATSTPPALQTQFTEKLWCLPDTRLCFTPPTEAPNVSKLPVLSKAIVTFACFQNLSKINDDAIKLWIQILQHCPNSQLLIKNKQLSEELTQIRFKQRLTALNAPIDRFILQAASPLIEYYAAYHDADIMLDTFPYPGGTTTCDALWMGVPTLTLAGNTLLSRQGASMLHCVGLDDWVATDKNDYVNKAIAYAQNTAQLSQLRTQLRNTMQQSPLVDASRFAHNMENALFAMWQEKHTS